MNKLDRLPHRALILDRIIGKVLQDKYVFKENQQALLDGSQQEVTPPLLFLGQELKRLFK